MTEKQYTPEELNLIATEDDTSLEENLVGDDFDLQAVAVQIEKIADRQRQISATIQIPQPVVQVWEVLTNYEALADFIPNLANSRLLEHPNGGIRLEQVGSQRFLRLNFSARVVLDLEEYFPKEIIFQMVEGDFKDFSGSWRLEPYSLGQETGTNLCYTVKVWPKRTMPVGIIERRLAKDLQLNLLAIRQRLEELTR
ncbi:MAG: SRPBCC family protein [Fischerella sp.]|uniref:SRPBCC family protein n=1 Tax=Fischerella sp. TaxID=1191 RepID=UPI00184DE8C3|nr:SRPBCC family protein [Fischerella sp.]NWF58645.1 SRPBCC family protein [Fischerella sp.]